MHRATTYAALVATLLGATALTAPAALADDWSGGFAGAHAGYGWDDVEFFVSKGGMEFPLTGSAHDLNGGFGGVQGGYNWQRGNFVFGVMGDFSLSGMDGDATQVDVFGSKTSGAVFTSEYQSSIDWMATLRGRAGLSFGNVLAYATGGVAFVDTEHSAKFSATGTLGGFSQTFEGSETEVTWTAGGGVEIKLNDRISISGEYLYINLDDVTFFQQGSDIKFIGRHDGLHTARIGVNYRFNSDGSP